MSWLVLREATEEATTIGRCRALRVPASSRVLRPGGRVRFTVHDLDDTLALACEQRLIDPQPSVELVPGDFIMPNADKAQAPCYWHYLLTPAELDELCDATEPKLLYCDRAWLRRPTEALGVRSAARRLHALTQRGAALRDLGRAAE